ncbi:MAG: DUF3352 domain-containing protein [Gaiellaceae bacterium]
MRARMILGVAAAVSAAGLLAGCGGSSGAGSGSATIGAGAAVAPADSVAFVAIDTNVSSAQWQAVNGLLQKFPSHDELLAQLQKGFEQKTKLSWANDVQPALGPELDVVVLPAASNGKPELVALVQPADGAKLDALVQKLGKESGETYVSAQVGGWTAVAASQAALDAVTGATTHLADANTYQDATAKLAGDALATAYANGTEAHQLLGSLGKTLPSASTDAQVQWVSADVVAASGGLEVNGFVRTQGGAAPAQPYASALVSKIPSGALAVADFNGTAAAASAAKATATGLLATLGTTLGGETALYVSPGQPIPSVTLVTHPTDPQAAADALDKAFAGLGSSSGSSAGPAMGGLGAILGNLHLYPAIDGGTLVASTSQQAIADFQGGGPKLADDGAFKEATAAASMPAETNGFVYVNLKDALPLVEGLAGLMGAKLPAGLQDNLAPLRSVTGYATRSGDETSFTVFVEIR